MGPVGSAADTPCSMALTLSIASMYQLAGERRVDVGGELMCPAVHAEPLVVADGDVWIRPEEGIPRQHGQHHRLLRYRLLLRDADGGRWWGESEGRWGPAPLPGPIRDSYGCGDSFAAGFTFGLATDRSVAEAAALGAECGARWLTRPGAP